MKKNYLKNKKETQEFDELITEKQLLELLNKVNRPLNIDEILKISKSPRQEKKHILSLLTKLIQSEKVFNHAKHKYTVGQNKKQKSYQGVINLHSNGAAFVDLQNYKANLTVYINKDDLNGAMHNDQVELVIIRRQKDRKPEAKVIKIVENSTVRICARIQGQAKQKNSYNCRSIDPKYQFDLLVSLNHADELNSQKMPISKEDNEDLKTEELGSKTKLLKKVNLDLASGEIVYVELEKKLTSNLWSAKFLEQVGRGENIQSIELIAKLNNNIARDYPQAVLHEIKRIQEPKNLEKYKDLTHLDFVTIDGEDAKDFDDAIFVEPSKNNFTLYVAIADVAAYVRSDSALDSEAYARGNSFYFPQSVEAMLPKELSNDLCSLKAHEERYTIVCKMLFSAKGQCLDFELSCAKICSQARLTYNEVDNYFEQAKHSINLNIAKMLDNAKNLAQILISRRDSDGALDFDLPEAMPIFDDKGIVIDFQQQERLFSHRLIEAFMLAANEAVASYLQKKAPCSIYRVHPEPELERLEKFFTTIAKTNFAKFIPKKSAKSIELKKILKISSEEHSLESKLIHKMALRAMMQAKYSPDSAIHFGLASDCYTHFTSPIRRYSDLIIHRLVRKSLGFSEKDYNYEELLAISNQCNSQEKNSKNVEREVQKRLACSILQNKIGQKFKATISGLNSYALFAELDNYFIEGFLRLEHILGDYYVFDEKRQEILGKRSKKRFRLGDKLTVQVYNVMQDKLDIELRI